MAPPTGPKPHQQKTKQRQTPKKKTTTTGPKPHQLKTSNRLTRFNIPTTQPQPLNHKSYNRGSVLQYRLQMSHFQLKGLSTYKHRQITTHIYTSTFINLYMYMWMCLCSLFLDGRYVAFVDNISDPFTTERASQILD